MPVPDGDGDVRRGSGLAEAVDGVGVDAVGVELPGDEVAGAHPAAVHVLPERDRACRARPRRRGTSSPARARPGRRRATAGERRRTPAGGRRRGRGSRRARTTRVGGRSARRSGRGTPGRPGSSASYWSTPVQPTIAFHTISFSQAFWNAVPMNRGGSQSSACMAKPTSTTPNPNPQWTTASTLGVVELLHLLGDVLGRLGDRLLGHDAEALALARPAELLDVGLADQRLLDQHADVVEAPLGDEVGPEDRLVGHRAHRQREGPLARATARSR